MKTKKTFIYSGLIVLAFALFALSCNSPLSLGTKLDVEGPVVEFTSPSPRKTVPNQFTIEGKVSDRSAIDKLLIKTSVNNVEFPKQWRFTRGTGWQVSEDYGINWTTFSEAEWKGSDNSVSWNVAVDLSINGVKSQDGEYMFTAQAWDIGGMSTDNSLKTRVLIYDSEPPKVEVFNPFLYSRFSWDGTVYTGDLAALIASAETADEWRKPELIGKFLSQEFQLQWQIEDDHDVASIELLFYGYDVNVDGFPGTDLPSDYIYSFLDPSVESNPSLGTKPNGDVWVPDLNGDAGTYTGKYKNGVINNPLTTTNKTVIKVVSICYDNAGWANQEKVLGYFVYWPDAQKPWITYTDGMRKPSEHVNDDEAQFKSKAFMIYPGRNIRANAFQAQGVSKIEFSLLPYDYSKTGDARIGEPTSLAFMAQRMNDPNENWNAYFVAGNTKIAIPNTPRPNGSYSTNFGWDFMPEARSGNYVVRAVPFYSVRENGVETHIPGDEYDAVFMVQDITFPDFPTPPYPTAGDPLFKFIGRANGDPRNTTAAPANSIRISGIVADATAIDSIYMAWINPQSVDFAAMSQLSYFRDPNYTGWNRAINANLTNGAFIEEDEFDKTYKNKVWKVAVTPIMNGSVPYEDPDTGRRWFRYDQVVSLPTHMNIASGNQPLKSQVFLFRAQNTSGRSTIITYAPKGDTGVPTMKITTVQVGGRTFTPGQGFEQIPQFKGAEQIIVNGTWNEDSTEYLDRQTYFYNNMRFSINGFDISGSAGTGTTVTITPTPNVPTSGTFRVTADVRDNTGTMRTSSLRDTLVVNVSARDIGNNPTEDGASWLVESDTLRLLRISSEADDRAYRVNQEIKIFMEFNKAVVLKKDRLTAPVLLLNMNTVGGNQVTGVATYDADQEAESTRHYFTYKVLANHDVTRLNVTGISIDGGANALATNSTAFNNANYPFTFLYTNTTDPVQANWTTEEIRLTRNASHTGGELTANSKVYFKAVPVDMNNTADRPYTLGGGKDISIDNTAPKLSSISASPEGWHKAGVDIFITAVFDENVKIGTGAVNEGAVPYLILSSNNSGTTNRTLTGVGDVQVRNDRIIFKYRVLAGDSTGTSQLQVTGLGGDIFDVPGNVMASMATQTLTGVYLDTAAPTVPTVTIWQGFAPANNAAPTGSPLATSGSAAFDLGNMYHENMFVRVEGTTGTDVNLGRLEYTLNGGALTGETWTSLTSGNLSTTGAVNVQITNNGPFTVQARQIDRAGNIVVPNSGASYKIDFNLDRGTLVSSISSTTPNGDYTKNAARSDSVSIQVNFRKSLVITGASITLNVHNGTATTKVINGTASGATNQYTFTYTVAEGDHTNGENLTVSALNLSATDGGKPVPTTPTNFMGLPAAGSIMNGKAIKIITGGLTVSGTPTFTGTYQSASDTVTGTITVTFNRNIVRGSGNVTIIQRALDYRLPAVLTDAQRSKYRSTVGGEAFDSYYTRGTNGITGTGVNARVDTSPKHILRFNVDPPNLAVIPAADGVTQATLISTPGQFADVFRKAESVTLSATSSAVSIGTGANENRLTISLTGDNALQVPGGTYEVRMDAGFVKDALDYPSPAVDINTGANGNYTAAAMPGVARPYIRVEKKQDIIRINTGANGTPTPSMTVPRITADQPFTTNVRMDSRTPDSRIRYNTTTSATNITADNWYTGTAATATALAPQDNANVPAQPTAPTSAAGTQYNTTSTNGTPVEIGTANSDIATVQGFIWRVYAIASNAAGSSSSALQEDMAMRSVLTYHVRGMVPPGDGEQRFASGQQVWIRGGDAVGASTIPGFPLTWNVDELSTLPAGTRAGIRLMTLVQTPTNADGTNSQGNAGGGNTGSPSVNNPQTGFNGNAMWRWVTWEVTTDTYFDFILGNDDTNLTEANVAEITRFGPRQWAYQRAGWTSYKDAYRMFPGKHRYVSTDAPQNVLRYNQTFNGESGKGVINFSGTWSVRANNPTP